ncbi:histidine phosphatase family protein [Streptomyces hokutonensis]|uniref:histidine phosphatase family protein n=1 Tax=Streptomyces hokutonensis TaxID=1306990 RepID=UPI0034066275
MTVTTRLVITRHGEARCNIAGRVGGERTCTGLTDLGRTQVEQLATRLTAEHRAGPPYDVLYAGPRLRLQESGQILADVLDLPLRTDSGLDGPHHAEADGLLWRDVEAAFGGHPAAHPDRPWAPGSDTWNGYLHRAVDALAALLQRHEGETLLLAAHGETIHAACHLLLGVPLSMSSRVYFGADHACLTRFDLHQDAYDRLAWKLTVLNDTAHLHPVSPFRC